MAEMNTKRWEGGAAAFSGKIVLAGGYQDIDPSRPLNSVEQYNQRQNK